MAILFVGNEGDYAAWQKADAVARIFQVRLGRTLTIHKAYERESALAQISRVPRAYEAVVLMGLKLKARQPPHHRNPKEYGLEVIRSAVEANIPVLALKPDRKMDLRALNAGAKALVSLQDSPESIAKSLEHIIKQNC